MFKYFNILNETSENVDELFSNHVELKYFKILNSVGGSDIGSDFSCKSLFMSISGSQCS